MRHYIITLLLTATAALAFQSCGKKDQGEETERIFLSEMRSVNKLTLAGMEISKMASIDDPRLRDATNPRQAANAMIAKLKIGDRKAAYSYSTYLRAYIDMSRLGEDDVKADAGNKTIHITLPPVQTEFVGRDIAIREEHYRVTGLRSQIDPQERATLKENMNTALKREVEGNPDFKAALVATAKNRAASYFEQMAASNGYTAIVSFTD